MTDALIFDHPPIATADDIQRATGFLVVCQRSGILPGRSTYAYDHFLELNEAADAYAEYESGEYGGLVPVALMACRHGVPFAKLTAWRVSQLVRDAA